MKKMFKLSFKKRSSNKNKSKTLKALPKNANKSETPDIVKATG